MLPFLARSLPLLPSITPNVKFACAAKPLELRIRVKDAPDAKSKSGKNGNVDWRGQLCRAVSSPFTAAHPPLSYNHHGPYRPRIRLLADPVPHTAPRPRRTIDAKERFTWPSSWLLPKNKC